MSVPPDRRALLANVADLYYVEDRSQQAIADQLGVSRSKVSRLLAEARDTGVVEIRIHRDPPGDGRAEAALREAFPDLRLTVVAATGSRAEAVRAIGDRTARLIESVLRPGATLAVTHGSTVYEVIRAIRTEQLPGLRMVQMAGFEIRDPQDNGWQLVRLCVDRIGAGYRYVHAPLLVSTDELYRALMADRDNREIGRAHV